MPIEVSTHLYPLDAINPGEWQVDAWIVAAKLLDPHYYIGGWTTCEYWGLTEQIFLETVLVTTRKIRSKRFRIQGFPFLVKRVPEKKMFGTKTICRDETRVNISDPSRTILDVLEDPSIGGGIHHVVDVIDTYFRAEHRDDYLLATYVGQVGNCVVFKRLGHILEELEVDAEQARRLSSERRQFLDSADTIATFAAEMSDFLKTSELTETRAFVHSFVKEVVVKPGRAAIVYSIPTPEDSPIGGADAAEIALNGEVRKSVRYGGR